MNKICLTIPGEPLAQPRVKARAFGEGISHIYTPTSVTGSDGIRRSNGLAEYKALVRKLGSEAYTGAPIRDPIEVHIVFVFSRPSNKVWKKRPMPRYPHTGQRDVDNLYKAITDPLQGIIWHNDGCIFRASIEKWHASGSEQPATYLTVTVPELTNE